MLGRAMRLIVAASHKKILSGYVFCAHLRAAASIFTSPELVAELEKLAYGSILIMLPFNSLKAAEISFKIFPQFENIYKSLKIPEQVKALFLKFLLLQVRRFL